MGLTVTVPMSGGALELDWTNNSGPELAWYSVYRGTTNGGLYNLMACFVNASAYSRTGNFTPEHSLETELGSSPQAKRVRVNQPDAGLSGPALPLPLR